jgi:hypothetical protein
MRRKPLIGACILAAAVCLMPLGRSAELVTLRNGFQMRCDHHAAAAGSVRIYLTSGSDSYIELLPSQIASVSQVITPPTPPISKPVAEALAPGGSSSQNSLDLLPSSASAQPALTSADLRQMLARAGRSHNLDVDLLASVVHAESGGNPRAVSRAGARGLMQLMPSTAAALGVQNGFQPQQNVGGGSAYLDAMLTRYSGNLALALAAYNAGPQAVDRYRGVPPYPETRAYVARVIHEFNRRVLARRAAATHPLPHKLQAAVSQK